MELSTHFKDFIAWGIMLLAAIGFSAAAILMPWLLGPRRTHSPVKDSAYECGLPPLTERRVRFDVKFNVVAMLFILFDIEAIFLLGWAVLYRDLVRPVTQGGLGWAMCGGAMVFLLLLELGHIYAWKSGALDWAPRRRVKQP